MRKAGGIIALIAGIFAVFAALVTGFVGGLGAAFEAEGANLVISLFWGGLFTSFAVIVLGAVAMNASGRAPGVLLIAVALVGAIIGGTFVAICMVLALIGGILALFGPSRNVHADAV